MGCFAGLITTSAMPVQETPGECFAESVRRALRDLPSRRVSGLVWVARDQGFRVCQGARVSRVAQPCFEEGHKTPGSKRLEGLGGQGWPLA